MQDLPRQWRDAIVVVDAAPRSITYATPRRDGRPEGLHYVQSENCVLLKTAVVEREQADEDGELGRLHARSFPLRIHRLMSRAVTAVINS